MADDERARLTPPVGARDHVEGPDDAPVTLVEYGDYECPYCGRAYPIVKKIQAALGSRSALRVQELSAERKPPARATRRGGGRGRRRAGAFWEMHDALFEHQRALEDRQLVGIRGGDRPRRGPVSAKS